jgi:hypothetical protein
MREIANTKMRNLSAVFAGRNIGTMAGEFDYRCSTQMAGQHPISDDAIYRQ